MTGGSGPNRGDDFSLARLALFSLGAAVAALAVATVVIVVLKPSPGVGLVIGLAGSSLRLRQWASYPSG